jgi:hypothetical protein
MSSISKDLPRPHATSSNQYQPPQVKIEPPNAKDRLTALLQTLTALQKMDRLLKIPSTSLQRLSIPQQNLHDLLQTLTALQKMNSSTSRKLHKLPKQVNTPPS